MKKVFSTATLFLIVAFVAVLLPIHRTHALTITPIRLEINGNPGQVLSQQMTLINEQNVPATYYVSYANFETRGETGSPSFVDATDDLGTWMSAPSSVTVPAKTSIIVPIQITIPRDANPGGHFASIFWGTVAPDAASGQVAIGTKMGLLVLLRVNGEINEEGGILEFSTKDARTFFTALPISFQYRFQNAGDDRIKPTGDVIIKNTFGMVAKKISGNPVEGNILPRSIRKFETVWEGKDGATPKEDIRQGNFFTKAQYEWRNFAFGRYRATMALSYGTKNEVATSTFAFWVFPWHLSLVSLITALVLFFISRMMIRRYNRWVIKQARTMMKRESENAHEKEK